MTGISSNFYPLHTCFSEIRKKKISEIFLNYALLTEKNNYFSILRIHLLICYYLIGIGQIATQAAVWLDDSLHPKRLETLHNFGIITAGYFATDLLRFLWIAFIIERIFATIYCKVYEKGNFIWLIVCLSVIVYGFAGFALLLRYLGLFYEIK